MLKKQNKTTVEIFGKKYCIVANSSELDIQKVAEFVDDRIRNLAKDHPNLDFYKLVVLSAVNIANDYLNLKKESDEIMSLIKDEVI